MERISWTDRVKMKICYIKSRNKGTSYIKHNEGSLIGLVTCIIGTPF
jgi:hypothetical protein